MRMLLFLRIRIQPAENAHELYYILVHLDLRLRLNESGLIHMQRVSRGRTGQLRVRTVINFSTSSMRMTGALMYSTACHSAQLSGVIANRVCHSPSAVSTTFELHLEHRYRGRTVKKGMYRIATCKSMLSAIAATRKGFFHSGNRSKLSFSDSEFIALNISIVTRIERLIVVARCAISFVNISHPTSGNSAEHWWKCVWGAAYQHPAGILYNVGPRTNCQKEIWGPPT